MGIKIKEGIGIGNVRLIVERTRDADVDIQFSQNLIETFNIKGWINGDTYEIAEQKVLDYVRDHYMNMWMNKYQKKSKNGKWATTITGFKILIVTKDTNRNSRGRYWISDSV